MWWQLQLFCSNTQTSNTMKIYDWIVVGGGITGAALSYELAQQGLAVLLLERQATLAGATRYSYGGLAYWSGTTALTSQLCEEGIARHRILSEELDTDTQFRELDLLLTIAAGCDPAAAAADYAHFAIPPRLLSVKDACSLEPLLSDQAIAGALTVKHGHVQPHMLTQGYTQAYLRAGGVRLIAEVVELVRKGDRVLGVKTTTETLHCANVVVCAGGLSRNLLNRAGIAVRLYFTHAELIETPVVDVQLRTLVMPANMQRFQLEAQSSQDQVDKLWDQPGHQLVEPILDAGAIQFVDGSLRLGQISRTLTDCNHAIDAIASEAAIRAGVEQVLPALGDLPGTWHHCLVGFSCDRLPLVGAVSGYEGIYVFSGFSNPLVIVPPLAQRFANWATEQQDEIIAQLSPSRET